MPGIIEGYNYDIFISYRQNDNKYDGWVTEFINNLNKELEATIKDKINVYFDANPHDGLLETHLVSSSLVDKLKCLIFIPILSRTYCDPKSFAWNNEFLAFIKFAENDKFGLNIKLGTGNFASRVLPVRIHDLDAEDTKLVESRLGYIRSVDFIYHSQGVNRPLRQRDDDVSQNIKQYIYRDQINKTANAIDEIISSLRKLENSSETENIFNRELSEKSKQIEESTLPNDDVEKTDKMQPSRLKRLFKIKSWWVSIALVLTMFLIVILWYIWPFLIKPKIIPKDFESSVAVTTFEDISDLQGFQNFATGVTNDLISRLTRIQNLKVIPISESPEYEKLSKSAKAICKDYEVQMLLNGSIKVEGENIILTAELINGEKDIVLLQESKADKLENILSMQDELVNEVARAINSKYSSYKIQSQMSKRPTRNFKAYELYLKGNSELTKWTYESLKESLTYYNRALALDPNFVEPYSNSALANLLISYFYENDKKIIETIKKNAKRTLDLEDDNEVALMSMEGYYLIKMSSGQKLGIMEYRDMINKLKKLILKNPSSPMSFFGLAEYYRLLKKDSNKATGYLKMALTQCEGILQSDPSNGIVLGIAAQSAGLLGQFEYNSGHFLEAIQNTEYSIKLVPCVVRTYIQLSNFYFDTDQPQKARNVLDQAISNVTNADDRAYLGLIQGRYSMVEGKYPEAERYWADAMTALGDPGIPVYDYALLYRYVILCKSGNLLNADSLLHKRLEIRGINSWPEPIISFLAGNTQEEDIIKLAKRDWQKCEAFFFIGEKDLIQGNLAEAKKHFEESVNTGVSNYLEYDMSQAELSHVFQGIR